MTHPELPSVPRWLRRARTYYRTSVLTRYGRDLRQRLREPFDPDDYIEVGPPTARAEVGAMTLTSRGKAWLDEAAAAVQAVEQYEDEHPHVTEGCPCFGTELAVMQSLLDAARERFAEGIGL